MQHATLSPKQQNTKKTIDVAVAVIVYEGSYLLGYRNAQQHQGNRYEFVGGKVENEETALEALIREIDEEIGITLAREQCSMLGDITHDYSDKTVCLHVFEVTTDSQQFNFLSQKDLGNLNQPLVWVTKADLLSGTYQLPEANAEILDWIAQS